MESARADVLIETIRGVADGTLPWWPWHIQRLMSSAAALGFAPVPSDLKDRVERALQAHIAAGRTASAGAVPARPDALLRVRLLYGRDGNVHITVAPLAEWEVDAPAREQNGRSDRGTLLTRSTQLTRFATDALDRRAVLPSAEPLLQHKATYRPWYDAATHWLEQQSAVFDLIFLNERGEVCEGTRTNVYVFLGGQWLTPPASDGCLPGTVRAQLLAAGKVQTRTLTRAMWDDATGWRMSNGLRGWFDVRLSDDQR